MKKISLLITCILLISCKHTGYTLPDNALAAPESWEAKNDNYANTDANLVCLPWWQQFKDPALDNLIDKGLQDNNNIQIAMANIEAAQGELKRVQLNWIPEVSAFGGYDSYPDLGFPGVLLVVMPSYTLNIFKQIKEQKRANYELKATEAMRDGIRLAVIGQITSSYFSYVGQIEQLELLRSVEADLSKLMQLAQAMHDDGLYAKTLVEKAKTELHLIQAREKVVKQNIEVSQNSIRYLLNENPGKLPNTRKFSQLNGEQMIIGALPFNIIENRPDMQQAAEELKASNEGIGVAFSRLLPTVELSMARGDIATVPNGYDLGQKIYFDQAMVEVPLLKASTYGQMATAKGLNKAAYYKYSDTLRLALRDINNDLSAHDLYSKRLHDAEKAKQNLNTAYQLNEALYERGIISYLELIEERIKLTTLALEVNQLKLDQFITIVNLYVDLAAGFNYTPEDANNANACSMQTARRTYGDS